MWLPLIHYLQLKEYIVGASWRFSEAAAVELRGPCFNIRELKFYNVKVESDCANAVNLVCENVHVLSFRSGTLLI